MKAICLLLILSGFALIFTGCESSSVQGDRLGGRAGVAMTSQDMSHVAPTLQPGN